MCWGILLRSPRCRRAPPRTGYLPRAIGYVKTHDKTYLPSAQNAVVSQLEPGQRTPVFLIGRRWNRYAWYLRLPVESGVPWAGIVRCEASPDLELVTAVELA